MKNRKRSKNARTNMKGGRNIVQQVLEHKEGGTTFIIQENSFLRATDNGKAFTYTIIIGQSMQKVKEGGFESLQDAIFAMYLRHDNL